MESKKIDFKTLDFKKFLDWAVDESHDTEIKEIEKRNTESLENFNKNFPNGFINYFSEEINKDAK